MKVAIFMGSDSDWPLMKPAAETLKEYGVEVDVLVASAHRTPEKVHSYAKSARENGVGVIIAAAGAAAHLAGVIASCTTLPIVGVPINATPLNGMDALLSTVQMPSGIPVGTMAVNGAKNAAIFAVQILAVQDKALQDKLTAARRKMVEDVEKKAARVAAQL
ncbi:5-(carboxyamino)imidazole ribonucleotide mutase [Selenomonas sp. TAMA-11512]|uniref:5-(carboxyamino)imidazole ribonucleotide mutase n=1 Tax=Selenomonas sp. TAMA-11512 TaxID=3095337 RepID=UPI00308A992F|nr:5-(carboxyamino)imidazole ribonucleotide mutase [Selenomonas sp. TAMA-11512]